MPRTFTRDQREHTTILVSGLTMAHDLFIQAALRGIGYKVLAMDTPDNDALQYGREYGNRGQCNPTYFTVGNLVKYLDGLRERGMTRDDIVKNQQAEAEKRRALAQKLADQVPLRAREGELTAKRRRVRVEPTAGTASGGGT